MKMRYTIAVALFTMLFSGMVNAGGGAPFSPKANANATGIGIADSKAISNTSVGVGVHNRVQVKSLNKNYQNQLQLQHQKQLQLQGQHQGNVGLGSGNETTINQQYEEVKQDIPAYAPDAVASPATAPCIKTWAGSGGGLGLFSAGVSGYVKDHGCAFGEVARRAYAIGDHETAKEALAHMMRIVKEEAGVTDTRVEPEEVAQTNNPPRVAITGNNFVDNWH